MKWVNFQVRPAYRNETIIVYSYNLYLFDHCVFYFRPRFDTLYQKMETEFHFGIFRYVRYRSIRDIIVKYVPLYRRYRSNKAIKAFNRAK